MKLKLSISLGVVIGLALVVFAMFHVERADASRNSSGTYSLPAGNPVVSGTTITSTWANTTLSDIKTELTSSLDRSGRGAMLNSLQCFAGTVSAPGLTFSSDTNSGIYRAGSHDLRMSINGADTQSWNTTGSALTGTFSTTKATTLGNNTTAVTGADAPVYVFQRVEPIAPAPNDANYPLGHDLWPMARGSADLRLSNWALNLTSTTSVSPGSATIATGTTSTVCPSTQVSTNCDTLTGSTAQLCKPAAGCSLVIDQDTANEETITSANWSIASATSITAVFAKSHTASYNVRQIGGLYADSRILGINLGDVADRPLALYGRGGVPYLYLPNDTAGTFPSRAIQQVAVLTGKSGANSDLLIRNAAGASCTKIENALNNADIFKVCESSDAGTLTLGNPAQVSAFRVAADSDITRMFGGGSANSGAGGIHVYTSPNGTNSLGTFRVQNDGTDDESYLTVDTRSGGTTTVAGNLVVQAQGHSGGNPGNLTVAGTTTLNSSATSTGTFTGIGFSCTGSGFCGSITLAVGAGSRAIQAGCRPICTDTTAAFAVKCSVSGTTLTVAGNGSDTINYFCF